MSLDPNASLSVNIDMASHSTEEAKLSFDRSSTASRASLPTWASDSTNAANPDVNDLRCDIVANYLYHQQQERLWISRDSTDQGVVLKKSRNQYTSCPAELAEVDDGFMKAAKSLNARVAITVSTKVIRLFLQDQKSSYVPLSGNLRLQVLQNLSYLPRCQKHQFAAFIADRKQLIVWDDNPRLVLKRATRIESELLEMVWHDGPALDFQNNGQKTPSTLAHAQTSSASSELEKAAAAAKARPVVLFQPLLAAIAIILTFGALGIGWRAIAIEIAIDQGWDRLAFAALAPLHIWMGFFFFQSLVGSVFGLVGPISQLKTNTKYFSAVAPPRLDRDTRGPLPHVTVQMPVYKESLAGVIEPTITSIKAAISTYEMQGGTANIFVNDDGMQLLDDEMSQARRDFYDEHNIGWVARPKHLAKPPDGGEKFIRRGKFKKASNMNYAMWVSNRVEQKLLEVVRSDDWTEDDERERYSEALCQVIGEDQGRTWAEGNVRIGDYILLIDSDTRVPADCFLDAVSEMEQAPEVAIIQYTSGVMNVTKSFFENGISFFTNLVYTQIRFAVANGEVAPFIGHNAVLRWSAMQQIAYSCPDDYYEKYWTEATVSEDFDLALRLQTAGYLVRLATYTNEGYQEGVSLTVYDELARWCKYAYGCSELIFHPLVYWPLRGPFTVLFRRFVTCGMQLSSKLTIMAYMGTYFALASAWLLTLLNYFLVGWFNGFLDHFYLDSFRIYVAITLVFTVLGNISLAVLRYRLEEKALLPALVENVKWMPLLVIFLGGISLHVSQAIVSHLLGVEMSWGATSKEAEETTFFTEVVKLLKKFKGAFTFCIGCAVMMMVLAWAAPFYWRIRLFVAIWPLASVVSAHFLLPVALNPSLMRFTW